MRRVQGGEASGMGGLRFGPCLVLSFTNPTTTLCFLPKKFKFNLDHNTPPTHVVGGQVSGAA
jgi:hypothetical protein